MMKKLLNFFDSLDYSPLTIIVMVLCLTVVRLFLESFSSPEPTGFFAQIIGVVSYASLYGMLITFFTILLSWISKKPMMWALRVVTLIFPIVILTPLIDLAFSGGTGFCIGYVQSADKSFIQHFFTFLFPHGARCGITPGLRIQIIVASIGMAGIVGMITKSWWRTIVGGVGTYAIAFVGGILPIIINIITRVDNTHTFLSDAMASLMSTTHYPADAIGFTAYPSTVTTALLARAQLLICIIGILIIWFYAHRSTWNAWWKGLKAKLPVAGIHFMLMIFGLTLGYQILGKPLLWPDWLGIIIILLAWTFACSGLGAANDLNDQTIDEISNKKWWLIEPRMEIGHLKAIQTIAIIFAIMFAWTINYNVLYCMFAFMAAYGMHSGGIRFKQFWPTSTFFIVLSGCATFLAGYFALSGDQVVGNVPLSLLGMIAFLLIPYSIVKDIPDVAGDSKNAVYTFPVYFGVTVTSVLVVGLVILWIILFSHIIPWFIAIGVIASTIVFTIKRSWIYNKSLLFGITAAVWCVALLIHILFII